MTPQEAFENFNQIDRAVRKALSVMRIETKATMLKEVVDILEADLEALTDLLVMLIITNRVNFQKYMNLDLAKRNL
jgi:hypothetical protein